MATLSKQLQSIRLMQRFDVLLRYWGSWVVSFRGRGRIEKEGNLQTGDFPFLQVVRKFLGTTPSRHQPNHLTSVWTLDFVANHQVWNHGGRETFMRRLDAVLNHN